jgi:hypothetical protein
MKRLAVRAGGLEGWRRRWALALCTVAIGSAPLLAHHSFASMYLEKDTLELEGEVIEFQYKNPHSWVFIAAEQPFSASTRYAAEWGSRSSLDRSDINQNTLRVGDRVRMWVSPNRDPSDNRVRLKRIERPADHWRWGGNPRDTR